MANEGGAVALEFDVKGTAAWIVEQDMRKVALQLSVRPVSDSNLSS